MMNFNKKIIDLLIVVHIKIVEIQFKEVMECVVINAFNLDAHIVFKNYVFKMNNFVFNVKGIVLIM